MASSNCVQYDSLSSLYQTNQSSEKNKCSTISKLGVFASALAGSVVGAISSTGKRAAALFEGNVIRTMSYFGIGMSLTGLISSLRVPRIWMTRLRIEAWRLGIPVNLFLTQLYLNTDDPQEKQWIINAMMISFGIQVETVLDTYSTKTLLDHVKRQNYSFIEYFGGARSEAPFLEGAKIKTALSIIQGISGLGLIGFSFWKDQSFLLDFGSLILASAFSKPLWDRVENWSFPIEESFILNKRYNSSAKPPFVLRAIRIAKKVIPIATPIIIAGQFFHPNWWTMAIAGFFHGIESSQATSAFWHKINNNTLNTTSTPIFKNQCLNFSEKAWKGIRIGATLAGLTAFEVLTLSNHVPIDTIAITSFVSSVVLGWSSTVLVDKLFDPHKSSRFMKQIAQYHLYNPEFFGVDVLYFYYYATQALNIGSDNLKNLPFNTALLAAGIWFCLGWRSGRDLAIYESNRPLPHVSKVLMFQNSFTAIEASLGVID